MNLSIVAGLLIPFLGTTAGAACVFFLKNQIGGNIQRIFTGFAAGVMVAASVWSLLIPANNLGINFRALVSKSVCFIIMLYLPFRPTLLPIFFRVFQRRSVLCV